MNIEKIVKITITMAMVGSMNIEEEKGGSNILPAKLTFQVALSCVIAAVGGLMFGYEIGISGGVTSMDTFLLDFFPNVYSKKQRVDENNYCKFDDQLFQFFTSSLYLAGIWASFGATYNNRTCGRKHTIILASLYFLTGALLNLHADKLIVLILGRILLGFGIGFSNQTVPLYISEIAPARYRGGLNCMFQFLITIGILAASYVNYLTWTLKDGWRHSLGGAAVPALILLIGSSFFIHDTPASLIERGHEEEGKKVLKKIRGVEDVELEFNEIKYAADRANEVKERAFKELFFKLENRPPLVCGTLVQFFQQFTGINFVMFYAAPVLFQTMSRGSNNNNNNNDSRLISTLVTNGVNAISTILSILLVDIAGGGRKWLLVRGAIQMAVTQVTIGGILLAHLKLIGPITGHAVPLILFILICLYVSGFALSWGPLGWLVPSEIYPLEVRTEGYFCAVAMNMVSTFFVRQFFFSALCRFRSFLFFFFGAMNIIMGLFVIFRLPETKGVPIEKMADRRWMTHPHWKKYYFTH